MLDQFVRSRNLVHWSAHDNGRNLAPREQVKQHTQVFAYPLRVLLRNGAIELVDADFLSVRKKPPHAKSKQVRDAVRDQRTAERHARWKRGKPVRDEPASLAEALKRVVEMSAADPIKNSIYATIHQCGHPRNRILASLVDRGCTWLLDKAQLRLNTLRNESHVRRWQADVLSVAAEDGKRRHQTG